jgi:uncharacterized membrane protein
MTAIDLPTENALIQDFLRRVANGLRALDDPEKQDILAEIGSHLCDRVEELRSQGAPHPAEQAVAGLGDPAELAAQFVASAQQRRASRSYAPWILLRAAARIALSGGKGMLVFFIAIIGYGGAVAFLLGAILKPFLPQMGLWVGHWGMVWGLKSDAVSGHELLGQYFVPASIVLSFVFASGCTLLLQRFTRPAGRLLNRVVT